MNSSPDHPAKNDILQHEMMEQRCPDMEDHHASKAKPMAR